MTTLDFIDHAGFCVTIPADADGLTAATWYDKDGDVGVTAPAWYWPGGGVLFLPVDCQADSAEFVEDGRAVGHWVEASSGARAVLLDGRPHLTPILGGPSIRPSRMAGATFAAYRQLLGLTLAGMGERLGVRGDTVKRWEAGKDDVPYAVPGELAELVAEHNALVERMIEGGGMVQIRRGDGQALAAAGRALLVEPDLLVEWVRGS